MYSVWANFIAIKTFFFDSLYALIKLYILYFWKEKLPGSSILFGSRLLNPSFRLCFRKKSQGLSKYAFKQGWYKCQILVNELKNYLSIQYSWLYPYLENFYLGIHVGSRGMNAIFGLPQAFWPGTSSWPPHRDHFGPTEVLNIKKIMTAFCDRSHPDWSVPYMKCISM